MEMGMDIGSYIGIVLKLLLAVILGGIVGFEREHKSRPAGLRTHILVCVGAALVQITSINYAKNNGITMDPMRLGAQVISGIGFLGAGTIIKEGANIKGLTTAASLWAVGCIGLAAGSGLYFEAIAATIIILISLKSFTRIEERIAKERKQIVIEVIAKNQPGTLGIIGSALGTLEIQIQNVEMNIIDEYTIHMELLLKLNKVIEEEEIIAALMNKTGIDSIRILDKMF